MRKILVLSVLLFSGSLLQAQNPAISQKYSDSEIASLIREYNQTHHYDVMVSTELSQKFSRDFPNARFVEWETSGGEIYGVEFDISYRDCEAIYDKNGNLLMYRQEIRERHLPAIVKTVAESRYPKYYFEDIEKIVKGSETYYKLDMEYRESEITLFVSNEGNIISERFD